jgi:hypothetical protein
MENKHWNGYAEIEGNYKEPIQIGCIFHEHPDQKTLKKIGWMSELQEDASLVDLPYDTPDLQYGALLFVPSGIEGANGGVIQFVSGSYTECHLGLTKAIDLSKVKSIEIRIKVEKTAEQLYLGAIDANGKKSSAIITTYKTDVVTGEWMTVSLDVAKLTPVFGAEGVLNTIFLDTRTSCGNVYVDYISVTPNA